jgi:hypothetical protein
MEHSDHWIMTGWHGQQWDFQNNETTMEHSDHWIMTEWHYCPILTFWQSLLFPWSCQTRDCYRHQSFLHAPTQFARISRKQAGELFSEQKETNNKNYNKRCRRNNDRLMASIYVPSHHLGPIVNVSTGEYTKRNIFNQLFRINLQCMPFTSLTGVEFLDYAAVWASFRLTFGKSASSLILPSTPGLHVLCFPPVVTLDQ